MKPVAALGFALLCAGAHASTDNMCPVKLDPQGEMVCSVPPPPGTGLRADGRGAVHFPLPGFYEFRGGLVGSVTGSRWHNGGTFTWVEMQSSGSLEWTRPDGMREVVPAIYLYPPF